MPLIFARALDVLDNAFRRLEVTAPTPKLLCVADQQQFRSEDRSVEAAVIQKLARTITGLRAVVVLLTAGLYQEVGAIFRMLDEFSEDIIFLCQALRDGHLSPLHNEYLESFYAEEFDNPENAFASSQNRPTVSRRRIHAALAKIPESPVNPSDGQEVHRTLSQAFSGYVHGASVHILELYGGDPPRFHISGMRGTLREQEFHRHALHYFHRGVVTVMYAALCLNQNALVEQLYEFRAEFEQVAGMSFPTDLEDHLREIKRGKRKW